VNVKLFSEDLVIYDEEISAFNAKNSYQQKIDDFCLQYVATTRAAEQLFLYVEKGGKNSNYLEIFDFLKDEIPRNEMLEEQTSFDFYPVSETTLRKHKTAKKEQFTTQPISFRNKEEKNPNAIKIATPSKNYQNRIEKVRTGIFTHEILAKINSENDVEKTLEAYLLEGTITSEEKAEIAERIYKIIKNPDYARYFLPEQMVINEKDIMLSAEGKSKIYRPDRLISTKNGFIIIDFKTGDVQEKHQKQIDEYRAVLEILGHQVDETAIIYV
jgi:hypothetical protein